MCRYSRSIPVYLTNAEVDAEITTTPVINCFAWSGLCSYLCRLYNCHVHTNSRKYLVVSLTLGVTKLPKSAKHDVIQMHPETMSLCGLCIGQPTIVTQTTTAADGDPTKSICMVWPMPNLPAGSVGVHKSLQKVHGWDDGEFVKVEAVCGSVAAASSATVLVR